MNESIYSLVGAALGAMMFILIGREPLQRLIRARRNPNSRR
jgi:hypothetical protein